MTPPVEEISSWLLPHLGAWTTAATTAFALLGSYARGDAGPYSDVDLLRLVSDDGAGGPAESFLIDRRHPGRRQDRAPCGRSPAALKLVVLSTAAPGQIEEWFTQPEQAVNVVAGLREGRPLWDPGGRFRLIQERARRFRWTPDLQRRADLAAGREMVGWVEEVHKGFEGLRRNDSGRLLNAEYGLSWGLAWVMRLHRGILSSSDNDFLRDVVEAVGPETTWSRLLLGTFGVESGCSGALSSLHERVTCGLRLYRETFLLLGDAIPPRDFPTVEATAEMIGTVLPPGAPALLSG